MDSDLLVVRTLGIDIGSATMTMVHSELEAARDGSMFEITDRRVLNMSEVVLTPYTVDGLIDREGVELWVGTHLVDWGVAPDSIATGVVILTGTALQSTNSAHIAAALSALGKRLLSVAAGDRLEGMLAAYGSGAVSLSTIGSPVLNVDVGGGTTKLTVCVDGEVTSSFALDLGVRTVSWDPATRSVLDIQPSGAAIADAAGETITAGTCFAQSSETILATFLASRIRDVILGVVPPEDLFEARGPTFPLPRPAKVVLSGGFIEYLRGGSSPGGHGDLGRTFAPVFTRALEDAQVDYTISTAGIRCTVLGAGQHSLQFSGLTTHVSPTVSLPIINAAVSALPRHLFENDVVDPDQVSDAIKRVTTEQRSDPLVLGVAWSGSATYERLRQAALGLVKGVGDFIKRGYELAIVCDHDIAMLLGDHLKDLIPEGHPLLVIDGIALHAVRPHRPDPPRRFPKRLDGDDQDPRLSCLGDWRLEVVVTFSVRSTFVQVNCVPRLEGHRVGRSSGAAALQRIGADQVNQIIREEWKWQKKNSG